MGGMAAQIPIKGDKSANEAAMLKVKKDKLREVIAGHDGTWVAHPGLIDIAMGIFNDNMEKSNQINLATLYDHSREDLLTSPIGTITMEGLRQNMNVYRAICFSSRTFPPLLFVAGINPNPIPQLFMIANP